MRKLVVLLMFAGGCITGRYEWHIIQPINTLESRSVTRVGTEAKEENEGHKKEEKTKTETINGVWLYRVVRNNFNVGEGMSMPDRPRLRAIEVMFCPSRETDFSSCRVGVVWREDAHPFGRIVHGQP